MAHVETASLVTAAVLAAALAMPAQAANIYKYVDKDGRTVFDSSIPAEYVKNGYTVLNDKGQVIQEVKRAATTEELAKQQAAKDAEQKAVADKVAQEENDKLLIRLYRSPDDVVKKRDTALAAMKTQQDLARNNSAKMDEDIAKYQGVIDNNVKAGREAPADAKKKLEQAKATKDKSDASLRKSEEDRTKLVADAARDYKRLRELMGMPAEAIPAPAGEPAPAPAGNSAEKPAAK